MQKLLRNQYTAPVHTNVTGVRHWGVHTIDMRNLLIVLGLAVLAACGSTSSVTGDATVASSSASATIKVVGASAATCTVSGALGAAIGSGAPEAVSYTATDEEAAIMTCGSGAAIFKVGASTVTLTATSTAVAAKFAGLAMGKGTILLSSTVADLVDADVQASVSAGKGVHVWKDLGSSNNVVSQALVDVATALSTLASPTDILAVKDAVIKLLINSGEPVVIENVGENKTISACTNAAVAGYSASAVAVNASTIGMTGCLVYHSLDAVTDLNDPLGVSANNIPAAFRTVAKESGVIQELVNDVQNGRTYTMASINDYLFSILGHTVYSQDDEGVVTTGSISASNMSGILAALLNVSGKDTGGVETTITNATDMRSFKFHEGYNPSGGWEINAAAVLQTLPSACTDSNPATTCSVTPLKYNFDGTTLTQSAGGSYILEMQYSGGSFLNSAYVINAGTGKPYRDAFYQPVRVSITASSYSAIDYANPLYQVALDPMTNGAGSSAPFSDAAWRARYPAMSNVANAYLFPAPEVAARQIAVLQQNTNLTTIPALQAYAITKLMTRGMAAFRAGSLYEIFVDHAKTLTNWESLTATWLRSGTQAPSVSTVSGGTFKIQGGKFTFLANTTCIDNTGATVNCSISANSVQLNQTGQAVTGGTKFAVVAGNFSITSPPLGANSVNYTPTYLLVAPDNLSAQFIGDIKFYLSFTHDSNISTLITSGNKLQNVYSLTFYHR